MRFSRNRKGDLFMLTLDMLFLVAVVIIFWKLSAAFSQPNADEGIGTRQTALLHTYAVSEQMLLYVDEAARFAAYESLATVMAKGAQNQATPVCPDKYVEYPLWTTKAKACFPQTKQKDGTSVYDNFEKEMVINLRKYLKYPGFPSGIDYDIQTIGGNGLQVVGMTADDIVLPIVTAKDAKQQDITPLLLQDNVAKARTDGATPDTTVEGVTMELSDNRADRKAAIQYVVIRSTLTRNTIEAFAQYKEGGKSTHYLIDENGRIYQVVPEAQRASALGDCADCRIPDIEGKAIIVSLVNAGIGEEQLVEDKCTDSESYLLIAKRGWCDGKPCAKSYAQQCWERYPDAQVTALEALVIDVAHRNRISAKDILLEEQVRSTGGNPGPALFSTEEQSANDPQSSWITRLLTRVGTEAAVVQEEVEGDAELQSSGVDVQSSDAIGVILPVDNAVITSCFGQRNVQGSQEHFGVDFRAPVGTPIYAVADGTVTMMCDDWKDRCACSSRSASCPLSCKSLCAGRGQGYGNNILLKHSNDLYSHYSHLSVINIRDGQQVKRGDVIGLSGNTGSSTAPHLHFTIFTGEFKSLAKQNAGNPLCIYPDEQLRQIRTVGTNCAKYKSGLTHADTTLANECSGVETLQSAPTCGLNSMPLDARGSATVSATVQNINRIPNLNVTIEDVAKRRNIPDKNLIVAFIAAESTGRKDLVSPTGCAGIAQFCLGTANQGQYAAIFGSGLEQCSCPQQKKDRNQDCTAIEAGCEEDPRFNAYKSVDALGLHVQENTEHFKGKTDGALFAIAAYNAGPALIDIAIARTGKDDPRWPEVSQVLDESVVYEAYCVKSRNICSYFDTPDEQARKAKEIKTYVSRVGGYYIALGGNLPSAFADMECDNYNVRELGTYSFSPAFSVTVPDVLTSFDRTITWSQETYKSCDGAGGTDTRSCFSESVKAFNSRSPDLKILSCEDPQTQNLYSLRQAIEDCKANKQDGCTCSWTPVNKEQLMFQLSTIKNDLQVIPVTPRNHDDEFPTTIVDAQTPVVKSVTVTINDRMTMQVSDPDGSSPMTTNPTELKFRKDGARLIVVPDRTIAPACGVYKTMHQVCVQVKHPIPVLSKGTELQTPEIKFALWLNDSFPPTADVKAYTFSDSVGGVINIELQGTEDISYYEVTCGVEGQEFKKEFDRRVLGRQDDKAVKISDTLTSCAGQVASGAKYQLRTVPVDISGNRGIPVITKVQSYEDYTNPTGAVISQILQP